MNRYTNEQNTAKHMTVTHHGLNGIGNKSRNYVSAWTWPLTNKVYSVEGADAVI